MRITNDKYGLIQFQAVDQKKLSATTCLHTNIASGPFGEILHRSFQSAKGTVHDFDIRINEELTLHFPAQRGGSINLNVCLQGQTSWLVRDQRQSLQKHEYILYDAAVHSIALSCLPNKSCRFFTIGFPLNILHQVGIQYNGLKEFISNHLTKLGKGTTSGYASNNVLDLFDDISARPVPAPVVAPLLDHKLTGILLELFIDLYNRHEPTEGAGSIREVCARARNYILQDAGRHHSVTALARQFNVNQLYLQNAFKKRYGIGLLKFLGSEKMNYARHLLLNTDMPMKEISSLVGFKYCSNFIASFTKHFDYTPGSVRRKNNTPLTGPATN